jgi:hypothetical protein
VLPTSGGGEVGRRPTATANAGASAAMTGEVDRWSLGGTLSSTSEEHFRTELPQPSSSWFACERGLHRP